MADTTVTQFRNDFPEFANTTDYPDGVITFWLNVAIIMVNPQRWIRSTNLGQELFTAHNIVLEKMAADTTGAGGWPISKGPISSESPGAVGVSYDTSSASEKEAGHWNLTVYGTRFIHLAKLMGSGPIQVGIGHPSIFFPSFVWPGPPCFPWFNTGT